MKTLPKIQNVTISNKKLCGVFPDHNNCQRQDNLIKKFNEFFSTNASYQEVINKFQNSDLHEELITLIENFPVSDTLEIENIEEINADIYFPGNILFKQSIDLKGYGLYVAGTVKCLGDLTIYEADIGEGIEAETLTVRKSLKANAESNLTCKSLIIRNPLESEKFIIYCSIRKFKVDYLELGNHAILGTMCGNRSDFSYYAKIAKLYDNSKIFAKIKTKHIIMNQHSYVYIIKTRYIEMHHHAVCDSITGSETLIMDGDTAVTTIAYGDFAQLQGVSFIKKLKAESVLLHQSSRVEFVSCDKLKMTDYSYAKYIMGCNIKMNKYAVCYLVESSEKVEMTDYAVIVDKVSASIKLTLEKNARVIGRVWVCTLFMAGQSMILSLASGYGGRSIDIVELRDQAKILNKLFATKLIRNDASVAPYHIC